MAGRSQSSQPTIREELSPVDRLAPAVSAQQIFSYTQARPGYVAQGRDLQRLAESLDSFGGSFGRAARTYMDKKIAEDVSEAEQLYREHPELTKNMEAWRKAAEADPAVLNKSPWVKRYVEHAILRNEAQTIDAELRNFYLTSGLVNERDTKKVAEAVNAKMGELVRNSAASRYEDPLALGPNFHRPLRDVTGNLLAMHSASVEAQNAKLLMQEAHQNIDNMIRGITDPRFPNSLNPRLPSDAASLADRHAAALQTVMGDMMARGFRQADLVQFATDSVLRTGGSVSRMEAVLRKVTVPGLDGKPVSLLSQPGVRDMLEQKRDMETDRAWKAETRARTRRNWAREDAHILARNMGVVDGTYHDVKTMEEAMEAGISPEYYPVYVEQAKFGSNAALNPQPSNPLSDEEYQNALIGIRRGALGLADVQDMLPRLTKEQKDEAVKIALAMGDADEKAAVSAQTSVKKTLLASLVGQSRAEGYLDGSTTPIGNDLVMLNAVEALALSYQEEREAYMKRLNVAKLSAEQEGRFRASFVSNAMSELEKRFGPQQPTMRKEAAAAGRVMPYQGGEASILGILFSSGREAERDFERRQAIVNRALDNAVGRGMPIVNTAAAAGVSTWENGMPVPNTLAEQLLTLEAYGLALSPRETFDFILPDGKTADELGLRDEQAMVEYIRTWLITKGYRK